MCAVKTPGFWQPDSLRTVDGQAVKVELKVVVPEHDGRSLGLDKQRGQVRRVYFLDTPNLDLYRAGVIVRFRHRPHDHDDAVVKLRPVAPGRRPRGLRGFHVEIDALPGKAVCSGTLKKRLDRHEVARTLEAGRSLIKLLSSRQRKLLRKYAPAGFRLDDLTAYGPIDVRCHSVKLPGLGRGLTAERWRYPDGSDLLELSTRCPADQATKVAARVSSALRAYGVLPAEDQRTKTEVALLTP
jgi:hypothetical protein